MGGSTRLKYLFSESRNSAVMPTVRFTVGLMSNLRFQFSVTVQDRRVGYVDRQTWEIELDQLDRSATPSNNRPRHYSLSQGRCKCWQQPFYTPVLGSHVCHYCFIDYVFNISFYWNKRITKVIPGSHLRLFRWIESLQAGPIVWLTSPKLPFPTPYTPDLKSVRVTCGIRYSWFRRWKQAHNRQYRQYDVQLLLSLIKSVLKIGQVTNICNHDFIVSDNS